MTKTTLQIVKEMEQALERAEVDCSDYFHDDFEVGENIYFNTTIYVQPSIDDFSDDVKSSAIFALDFEVNEQVTISLQYSRFNDNAPPLNADKMDESISTKFSWNF